MKHHHAIASALSSLESSTMTWWDTLDGTHEVKIGGPETFLKSALVYATDHGWELILSEGGRLVFKKRAEG